MQKTSEISELNTGKLNIVRNGLSAPTSLNLITSSRPNTPQNCRTKSSTSLQNKINLKSAFSFKYISEPELEAVVKHVRRANQKKRDEEKWKNFLKSRKERNAEETTTGRIYEVSTAKESNSCTECHRLLEPASSEENILRRGEDEVEDELEPTSKLGVVIADDNISHTYQISHGLTKRLQDLLSTVNKMMTVLLSPGLHTQYEDEDIDRTIKRSLEFDAMFARNHLYEIQRGLKHSKQMVTAKFTNTADLENKISAGLKSVTQSLQVYTRHVIKGARVKYQQVVPIFQSISHIQSLLERLTGQYLFPMRQELEVSCSYVKQILLEVSGTETKTVSTVSHKPVRVRQRHKPSADLSMYSHSQKAEWKRKSASLAQARFGAPGVKKQEKSKVPVSIKEVPFRNATRAVPEECITTMMEMIPHEPLDDTEICLDESTFQALKLLNGGCAPLRVETQKLSLDDLQSTAASHQSPVISGKTNSLKKSSASSKSEQRNRATSEKSTGREAANVQLICLAEETQAPNSTQLQVTDTSEDRCTTLTIHEPAKAEALEYHQEMLGYHKSSPQYKDGKALSIVDRLANHILMDILLDFQREEMDEMIRILYNLEFE